MDNIDTYYINLYKSKFRTNDEKENEEKNTDSFSEYCICHPIILKPMFNWYFNVYFNGLHENSSSTMFEINLLKAASNGQTKIILFDDNKDIVMLNDCIGMLGFIFSRSYSISSLMEKQVYPIMEQIRMDSKEFIFKKVDWEYFFSELWYDTVSSIYMSLISDIDVFNDNFISSMLHNSLLQYGFKLEYIKDDNTSLHRSGLGIDLSSVVNTKNKDYILTIKPTV